MKNLHGFMSFAWSVGGLATLLIGQPTAVFIGMLAISAIHGCTDSIIKTLDRRT